MLGIQVVKSSEHHCKATWTPKHSGLVGSVMQEMPRLNDRGKRSAISENVDNVSQLMNSKLSENFPF